MKMNFNFLSIVSNNNQNLTGYTYNELRKNKYGSCKLYIMLHLNVPIYYFRAKIPENDWVEVSAKRNRVQRTQNKCLPWYSILIRIREHKLLK